MRKDSLKCFALGFIILFSAPNWAADRIKITVEIKHKSAAAIGYSVEGRSFGALGKSYLGEGPKNKKYVFGFRKNSIMGADIRCGELTLKKNSTVILEVKGDKCFIKII